ncbi:MAG TPA: transporter substrate-binding domain-containing protein [Acidimicrobiales bacterium]|nr:transporter substrate-binding domain-containing protein [Acidimicrobiales bacterium]
MMKRRDRLMKTSAAIGALALVASVGLMNVTAGDAFATTKVINAKENKTLHNELPAAIKKSGVINGVSIIDPPYFYYNSAGNKTEGLTLGLAKAIGQVLGVKVTTVVAGSAAQEEAGIVDNKYQIQLAPGGDTTTFEQTYDVIDWLKEYVSFAVAKGNPDNIAGLASLCGHTIGTIAGGSAVLILESQSTACTSQGSQAITISTFLDQADVMLALTSGRVDAAFSSQVPLQYYIAQSGGSIQLDHGVGGNGYANEDLGWFLPKGSKLGPIFVKAFTQLRADGIYQALLANWNVQNDGMTAFKLNASG